MRNLLEGYLEFRDGSVYDGLYRAWLDPSTSIIECIGTGPRCYPDFSIHIKGCSLPGAESSGARPIWYGSQISDLA